MTEGQFNLRNWRTNNPSVRQHVHSNSDTFENPTDLYQKKILRVLWAKHKDLVLFDFKAVAMNALILTVTKRNVSFVLSSAYDPTGLLQPFIVIMKIILQKMCLPKTDWDEQIPENLSKD